MEEDIPNECYTTQSIHYNTPSLWLLSATELLFPAATSHSISTYTHTDSAEPGSITASPRTIRTPAASCWITCILSLAGVKGHLSPGKIPRHNSGVNRTAPCECRGVDERHHEHTSIDLTCHAAITETYLTASWCLALNVMNQ